MWQYPLTIGIVLLAVVFVVRSIWRAATGGNVGCGSGCSKCAAPTEDKVPEGRIRLPQV